VRDSGTINGAAKYGRGEVRMLPSRKRIKIRKYGGVNGIRGLHVVSRAIPMKSQMRGDERETTRISKIWEENGAKYERKKDSESKSRKRSLPGQKKSPRKDRRK